MTFVGLFVLALIINALAPTFGGQKDSLRALKVGRVQLHAGVGRRPADDRARARL